MIFTNRIDERGRFSGLTAIISEESKQEDTHTFSYVYARDMYIQLGDEMGLDRNLKLLYEHVKPYTQWRSNDK